MNGNDSSEVLGVLTGQVPVSRNPERGTCRHCGVTIKRVPHDSGSRWTHVDEAGMGMGWVCYGRATVAGPRVDP